jgi:hypothetical protein
VRWLPERDGGLPVATLTAAVALPSLVALGEAAPEPRAGGDAAGGVGTGAGPGAALAAAGGALAVPVRSLALGGPRVTPAPGLLRDRSAPVVLDPRIAQVTWRIALPDGWCPAQRDSSGLDNAAGAFHQSLACVGGSLTVERRTELRQRWIDPQQLPALAALALAEHRAAARRLRLDRLHG